MKDVSSKAEGRVGTAKIMPIPIRMQPEMREIISQSAIKNNRSLSAEVVARLECPLASIRDDIATQIVAAVVARDLHSHPAQPRIQSFVRIAYEIADAMIAVREEAIR